MFRLQLDQFANQRVIVSIRNLRPIQLVIQPIVMLDLFANRQSSRCRGFFHTMRLRADGELDAEGLIVEAVGEFGGVFIDRFDLAGRVVAEAAGRAEQRVGTQERWVTT